MGAPQGEDTASQGYQTADQFLLASETAPRYNSRLQFSLHTGPTARNDAEEKERSRWEVSTPMDKILAERLGSIQLLGAGRCVSTLHSYVRAVRRFLNLSALNHDVGFPARQPEPCTPTALRGAHTATACMDEVAGVELTEKLTVSQVYSVIQKEVLANTIFGRPTMQAPTKHVVMLPSLEEVIVDASAPIYHRIYALWILVLLKNCRRFHTRLHATFSMANCSGRFHAELR